MANARLNVSPSGDEWIKELLSRPIANYIVKIFMCASQVHPQKLFTLKISKIMVKLIFKV